MNLSFLDFNYSISFNAIFSLNLIPIWILLCGLIYSTIYTIFSDIKNKLKFVFLIGISILCACLVFCSNNLITGFINYELLTLSTIPIIFYKKKFNDQAWSNFLPQDFVFLFSRTFSTCRTNHK